jgi:hypothetical protein
MPIMTSDLKRYNVRYNAEVVPKPGLVQLTGERRDCLAFITALGLALFNDWTLGDASYKLADRQCCIRGQFHDGAFRHDGRCQIALQTTWLDQASIYDAQSTACIEAKEAQ